MTPLSTEPGTSLADRIRTWSRGTPVPTAAPAASSTLSPGAVPVSEPVVVGPSPSDPRLLEGLQQAIDALQVHSTAIADIDGRLQALEAAVARLMAAPAPVPAVAPTAAASNDAVIASLEAWRSEAAVKATTDLAALEERLKGHVLQTYEDHEHVLDGPDPIETRLAALEATAAKHASNLAWLRQQLPTAAPSPPA